MRECPKPPSSTRQLRSGRVATHPRPETNGQQGPSGAAKLGTQVSRTLTDSWHGKMGGFCIHGARTELGYP